MTHIYTLWIYLSFLSPIEPTATLPHPWLEEFHTKVAATMAQSRVPGLAIGIVDKDGVVLAKGYGLADRDQKAPVTSKTVFPIGSITKSFTASLLAQLVEAGQLQWNQPIHQTLDNFRLQNPTATLQTTVADSLAHRTGMARHDVLWLCDAFDREAIYQRLRYLDPAFEFRETFHYSNLNYLIAGRVAEHLSGETWESLVHDRLITPLKMTRTWANLRDATKDKTFAKPYTIDNDQLQLVKTMPFEIQNIAPAGAIASCIEDMLIWLKLHMDPSSPNGVLAPTQRKALQTPTMLIPALPQDDRRGLIGVGMGWFLEWYQGHYLVYHSGVVNGYSAWIGFMPHQKIGVILLSNRYGNAAPDILGRYALDRLLNVEPMDWQKIYNAFDQGQGVAKAKKHPNASPSLPLSAYVGNYHHPAYGPLSVSERNGGLFLQAGPFTFQLKHDLGDHFEAQPVGDHGAQLPTVTFRVAASGTIQHAEIPLDPAVSPIVFQVQPNPNANHHP